MSAAAPLPAAAPAADSRALAGRVALAAVVVAGVALLWLRTRGLYLDDAFTGFRYVDNLLAGRGFVFNPGERVEGVTNAGWLLVLAPFAAVLGAPAAAKLLGIVLAAACALVSADILRRAAPALPGPAGACMPAMAAVLVLSQFDFAYFTLAGMETGLLALLLLGLVRLSLGGAQGRLVAALGGFAFAVHPEAILVYPLAMAAFVALRRETAGGALRRSAPFIAMVAIITLARWLYYGELMPNTFAAKSTELADLLRRLLILGDGPSPNLPFPFYGIFALPFLGAGVAVLARRSMLAAALGGASVLTAYLFALYAAPDWTGAARYFAPYLPLCAVAVLLGALLLETQLRRRGGVTLAVTAVAAALGFLNVVVQTSPARLATFPGYVLAGAPLVAPAEWLRDNLPADAVIATRRIGAVAYITGRPVFDYSLGLTDRAVARQARARGDRFWSPAHPALAPLWRERRPDYLLEDSDVVDRVIAETGGSPERFELHGDSFRVVRRFPLGRRFVAGLFGPEETPIDWVLAARITNP